MPTENLLEYATRSNFGRDPYTIAPDELGHRTRFCDSSHYDVRCVTCNATDTRSSKRLEVKCPAQLPPLVDHLIADVDGAQEPKR